MPNVFEPFTMFEEDWVVAWETVFLQRNYMLLWSTLLWLL